MRQAFAAGWVCFVVLAAASSPAHFWLDSGELGAAGVELGVMHPPGTPGLSLLLRAGALLPIGSVGFRMALVSAALGAFAIAVVFRMLEEHGAHAVIRWGAAIWLLSGWTFVRQARVVEIYTLAAALLVLVLWGVDPRRRGRERLVGRLVASVAAAWAAWCFGDLRLALVPLMAGLWLVDLRRGEPWTRWAPLCVAIGSCVVLALPLASARAPVTDWGDPDGVGRLWRHLNAESIRSAYADEILPASLPLWGRNLADALERLTQDLGPLGPALALVCLVSLWLRRVPAGEGAAERAWVGMIAWVVAVEVFYIVGINPMGGAARQTGLVLALLAALVVGVQLGRWTERLAGPVRWAVLPLAWIVLVLPAQLTSLPDAAGTRSWMPHAWARAALAQLPPGALLLSQSDDLAAGVVAARVLEGARPDVVAAPGQHLYRPEPDRARDRPEEHAIWAAAAEAGSEVARVDAAVAAHAGPVALEDPGAVLFGDVAFVPASGRVPLGVRGPGADAPSLAPRPAVEEMDVWLPHAGGREDRLRLAVALANRERARLRRGGDAAVAGAAATFELVLSRVAEDHPSTLVALGALVGRRGGLDLAIALTRRALEVEPDRHVALLNLALYLSQDPATQDEALAVARRATALRPWLADGWRRLAQVREDAGDSAGAQQARARAEMAVGAN